MDKVNSHNGVVFVFDFYDKTMLPKIKLKEMSSKQNQKQEKSKYRAVSLYYDKNIKIVWLLKYRLFL